MELESRIPGLRELRAVTLGDPVTVAVLDGPADLDHPSLRGADLPVLPTVAGYAPGQGDMTHHATFVTALVFGRPGTEAEGVAPGCRGVLVPVFTDAAPRASQLDLARAVGQALDERADVISISGGQPVPADRIDPQLAQALERAERDGVLVVAAVGNDGDERDQVPAAVPSVLAVGAHDGDGVPLPANNRGPGFAGHVVLAPGHRIPGAGPGGENKAMTGSSVATPAVAAVAALLLAEARAAGSDIRPSRVGAVLAATAHPGSGRIDVPRARTTLVPEGDRVVDHSESPDPTAGGPAPAPAAQAPPEMPWTPQQIPVIMQPAPATMPFAATVPAAASAPAPVAPATTAPVAPAVPALAVPASGCGCGGAPAPAAPGAGPVPAAPGAGLVYAIGTIGIDFGTEARRDGFRQQMARVDVSQPAEKRVPELAAANPYDPYQLRNYLVANPWASDKLIWTLNLDRTPIYALEAEPPVGMSWEPFRSTDAKQKLVNVIGNPQELVKVLEGFAATPPVSPVYRAFRDAIVGQVQEVGSENFVSRVSIPGVLTGRTVRLFSGQVLPVVQVRARGVHTWNESVLVDSAVKEVRQGLAAETSVTEESLRQNVRALLDKFYVQFRNLGQSAPDRARNYAATNAFMVTQELNRGLLSGNYAPGRNDTFFSLDTVSVNRSPYCRMDSDCWDVSVTFFDPTNDDRARVTYLFTIDVSDDLPVSLAPAHRFLGG